MILFNALHMKGNYMIENIDLIVSVAIDYYQNNMSQTEIAKKIHASRPTVSNLIKKAKDLGIVKIYIHHPNYDKYQLEQKIKLKYHLNHVEVVKESGDPLKNKELVGTSCSKHFKENIHLYKNIGIGWGSTLYHFIETMPALNYPKINIIALIGGFGINTVKIHSNHLAFKLSERIKGNPIFFNAPAIAESVEIQNIFLQSKLFQDMMSQTNNLDAVILGVGNPTESSTYRQLGIINSHQAKELEENGAVVDILANFYDQDMIEVPNSITDRMIGLPISHIKKAKNRIVLATGKEKITTIKTLLKSNFVTHLFIDEAIAEAL